MKLEELMKHSGPGGLILSADQVKEIVTHIGAIEQERDALKALMAAKVESIHSFVDGQKVSAINPTIELSPHASEELASVKAERDALAAQVEGLKSAMKEMCALYTHAWDLADGGGLICFKENVPKFDAAFEKGYEILEQTPAHSLASHDAELLERVADEWFMWHEHSDHERLRAEAKRIRAEAGGDGV